MDYLTYMFTTNKVEQTPEANVFSPRTNERRNKSKSNRRKRRRKNRLLKMKRDKKSETDNILPCTVEGQSVKPIEELQSMIPNQELKVNDESNQGGCIIC